MARWGERSARAGRRASPELADAANAGRALARRRMAALRAAPGFAGRADRQQRPARRSLETPDSWRNAAARHALARAHLSTGLGCEGHRLLRRHRPWRVAQ